MEPYKFDMGDTMKLSDKQKLFMRLLPRLLDFLHDQGYEVSGGDLFRDPRSHGELGEKKTCYDENGKSRRIYGRRASNHKLRLAIDLNLFKDGQYLIKTEDHQPIGEYWESLHELCRWGGRYDDGNHYSLEHQGKQ